MEKKLSFMIGTECMEIGYNVGHKKTGECPLCLELEGEKH
jgi:hypothetical protein